MNKKVSTLLTAGLMLCGTLFCGSAFAEVGDQISIDQAEEGTRYALVSKGYYSTSSTAWTSRNDKYVIYDEENGLFLLDDASDNAVAFTVTTTTNASGVAEYTFTSSYGALNVATEDGTTSSSEFTSDNVLSSTTPAAHKLVFGGTTSGYEVAVKGGNDWNLYAHQINGSDALTAQAFVLEELQSEFDVEAEELNALYNNKGFNLSTVEDDLGVEVQGNLFGGDTRIYAYQTTGESVTTDNGQTLTVPAGLYFFTDYVEASAGKPNWWNSTLIAVSPTESVEGTDDDRAKGAGFRLVEVEGSDFIYVGNTSGNKGNSISINNAAFSVKKSYDGIYAFSLPTFYYQASETYASDDDQTFAGDIELDIVSYNGGASKYIVTRQLDSSSYIFVFSDSGILDGIELLNTTQSPAVYTIKFVSVPSSLSNLNNKYLTVGSDGSDFRFEAKGAAITDTTYPIFQYVITSVKQNGGEKYTEITFTNRETGESFETQLFPEEGTNRYSMSTSLEVTPFTVNTTTYAVTAQGKVATNENCVVELTKIASVDEYAGFLNIANKTVKTLSFARDVNDTSNKLYVGVNSTSGVYAVNENGHFATDNTSAAQWQLVKSSTPTSLSRVYVYYDATNEMVNDVANGDKVYAYSYKLQYINDGTETKKYLVDKVYEEMALSDNGSDFYIKENVDGSVSFFTNTNNVNVNEHLFINSYVAAANEPASFDVEYNDALNGNWNTSYPNIYNSGSDANNLKVYLAEEAESTSWEDAGYVTIQSELGNYVSMNDDRDGIVVNEANSVVYYLHKTDKNNIIPSFFISEGSGSISEERLFMFNPIDSVGYYVAPGAYNTKYEVAEGTTKVIFKTGVLNETCDTLTMTIKGEEYKQVTSSASNNNSNIWGGINRFKFQIVETEDGDGLYYIRQPKGNLDETETVYLYNINDKLALTTSKSEALHFNIESVDDIATGTESVTTSEVKIVAANGAVNIKNAAGKSVVISTILGQIVANETLTSDNATIAVPSGIVIVSVEGEEAVKANIR